MNGYAWPVAKKPVQRAKGGDGVKPGAAKGRAKAAPEPARPAESTPAPRPIALTDLCGHAKPTGVLIDAMKSGRVHHCWVFHGPQGVGKFTAALAFAAVLLDATSGPSLTGAYAPEPGSHAQRMLAAGTHPDLRIITKELARYSADQRVRGAKQRNIPKAVIEEFVIDPATRTASAAHGSMAGRVFIIDEAELLEPPSQNALLKTLEEPPPGTVFILVTSTPDRLLPTIRSRSQSVFFGPLSPADMDRWLARSGVARAGEEDRWLRDFAAGSPGVYAMAAESGLFAWRQRIEPMLAQADAGSFPLELGGTMAGLIDEWAEATAKSRPNASKDAANQAGADWMFRLLASRYRGMLAAEPGPRVTATIDAIRRAETELDSNVNMLFVMDKLAAELAAR